MNSKLKIYDSINRRVKSEILGSKRSTTNILDLASGVYFISLEDSCGNYYFDKIIVE